MYKQCEQCGKTFNTAYFHPHQRFCSKLCYETFRRQQNPPVKKVKSCAMCGKEFEARHSRTKYCPDCSLIAKRERIKKIQHNCYLKRKALRKEAAR